MSGAPPASHCNGLPGLPGATQDSACIRGSQQPGNQPAPPTLFLTLALHQPPPLLTSMPFPTQMPPSSWLPTKAQFRHASSRMTALATPGKSATLISHLVISSIPPHDPFYNIYCLYCYSNANPLISYLFSWISHGSQKTPFSTSLYHLCLPRPWPFSSFMTNVATAIHKDLSLFMSLGEIRKGI